MNDGEFHNTICAITRLMNEVRSAKHNPVRSAIIRAAVSGYSSTQLRVGEKTATPLAELSGRFTKTLISEDAGLKNPLTYALSWSAEPAGGGGGPARGGRKKAKAQRKRATRQAPSDEEEDKEEVEE